MKNCLSQGAVDGKATDSLEGEAIFSPSFLSINRPVSAHLSQSFSNLNVYVFWKCYTHFWHTFSYKVHSSIIKPFALWYSWSFEMDVKALDCGATAGEHLPNEAGRVIHLCIWDIIHSRKQQESWHSTCCSDQQTTVLPIQWRSSCCHHHPSFKGSFALDSA